jgi:hypothetical protein
MAIVTTTIVWDPLLSPTDDAALQAIARQFFLEGRAVSEFGLSSPNIGGIKNNVAPMTTLRSWTTVEDAQAWVEIVNRYNPQSVTINS